MEVSEEELARREHIEALKAKIVREKEEEELRVRREAEEQAAKDAERREFLERVEREQREKANALSRFAKQSKMEARRMKAARKNYPYTYNMMMIGEWKTSDHPEKIQPLVGLDFVSEWEHSEVTKFNEKRQEKVIHERKNQEVLSKKVNSRLKAIAGRKVNYYVRYLRQDRITSLEIPDLRFGDEGARLLAEALRENKTVSFVNLAGNDIQDQGATYIGMGLERNPNIKELQLRNNWINSKGIASLTRSIKAGKSVQVLDITGNWIGDEGAVSLQRNLSDGPVRRLYLGCGNLTETGLAALGNVRGVSEMIIFNTPMTEQSAEALMVSARNNTCLEELSLWACDLENDPAIGFSRGLRGNQNLKTIILGNNNLKEHGIMSLSISLGLAGCSSIYFHKEDFGETGMTTLTEGLRTYPNVHSLRFDSCNIGDLGMAAVCEVIQDVPSITENPIQTLRELHLRDCGVDDRGATMMADTLRDNVTLQTLLLENNNITEVGAHSLYRLIELSNKTILELGLSGNAEVSEEILDKIESKLAKNAQEMEVERMQKLKKFHKTLGDDDLARVINGEEPPAEDADEDDFSDEESEGSAESDSGENYI